MVSDVTEFFSWLSDPATPAQLRALREAGMRRIVVPGGGEIDLDEPVRPPPKTERADAPPPPPGDDGAYLLAKEMGEQMPFLERKGS